MKFPLLGIDSTIEEHGLELQTGLHVDSFFVCWLFNAIDIPRRFYTAYEMVSHNPYLWLKLAEDAHSIYDAVRENMLVAVYQPDINTPFFRLYCYQYIRSGAAPKEALISKLSKKVTLKATQELHVEFSDEKHVSKVKLWVENLKKELAPTTLVAEGRLENTTVVKTVILYRQTAGCVICGEKATNFVGSTTGYEQAILFIANVCEKHQELAKNHPSILHFVFSLFELGLDLGVLVKSKSIPPAVIDLIKIEIERQLEVNLVKSREKDNETTLTFVRKSGFKIILRLNELMDYGYMINTPNGKPYRRIDSAPDHPDIDFFPDHIHLKPGKDNSDVISSYTYGIPLLDLPIIKKLVEQGEVELL
ncbi:hypothetical protein D8T49_21900 [Vibrio vulnificus]|uniref:toxin-antitoxin system TumE family protein n=1 Tax=Vibrio vulnificus TaxID=672 RepID=UPI001023934B|nr:DUF6516 family protein [Vibrio vulnificus]EGQ9240477.1 hypothetical protein [Vibrio vulnificus]EGQ9330349.1 hypothetical protein [Vibrio vulnificus]EGQ9784757.1 hypothetical protein [Vibrio vulnificus]EGR0089156.1 hypothetical protein [Vibrio vulnificus]EGR0106468.1 hypothetical protein [Vibrio vulnificus]